MPVSNSQKEHDRYGISSSQRCDSAGSRVWLVCWAGSGGDTWDHGGQELTTPAGVLSWTHQAKMSLPLQQKGTLVLGGHIRIHGPTGSKAN